MDVEFVNCTPHELTLFAEGENPIVLPKPDKFARVSQVNHEVGNIGGVRAYRTEYGEIDNLPAPKAGVIYIVSAIVLGALSHDRAVLGDVCAPDDFVRNPETGLVVGAKALKF